MDRWTAKLLLILDNIVLFALVLIFINNKAVSFLIAAVGLIIAVILSQFLRCPGCGRGQGRDWLFAQYCPYCGEYLD